MTVIMFKMHCLQLFADITHLWNILDSDVPDAKKGEVEVVDSLHPLHLKMKKVGFF